MKKWTKLVVIAAAAITLTAAPAMAGHRARVQTHHGARHRGGGNWAAPIHSRHHAGYTPVYHGPVYHTPVYHGPVYHTPVYHAPHYLPAYRSHYRHGWHGVHSIHRGGVGIHAGGLGIHIRF